MSCVHVGTGGSLQGSGAPCCHSWGAQLMKYEMVTGGGDVFQEEDYSVADGWRVSTQLLLTQMQRHKLEMSLNLTSCRDKNSGTFSVFCLLCSVQCSVTLLSGGLPTIPAVHGNTWKFSFTQTIGNTGIYSPNMNIFETFKIILWPFATFFKSCSVNLLKLCL